MALELGVSRKTIQNWESGISSPSFFQSLEWFRILQTNPFPYYLSYMFPDELNAIKSTDEEEKIQAAFQTILNQIPVSSKRALVYLFYGEHGSSPNAILQLILAYLHTPIKERVTQAVLIKNVYEMEKALGNLICSDDILPNMEVLNNALASAKASAVQHEYGYCYIDDESYR